MPEALFAFAAVLLFAFSIHCLIGLKPSFTPFVSLAVLVDTVMIFSMAKMLRAGTVISYILAFGFFALAVYRERDNIKEKLSRFLTPGVVLFAVSCLAMLLFLAIRQPLMSEWDEFSFWGTAQKLLRTRGQIYTYYESSLLGRSIPPSLAVLTYFFGGIGTTFREWTCFFAYDVLLFSCYRAFTAAFGKKQRHMAFFTYLFGFLCPYVFEVYTRIIHLEPVYMSTYADIPLGITFAGTLALFLLSERKGIRDLLPLVPPLIFLTLIKDMGFALGCLVVFVVFFDMLSSGKDFSIRRLRGFFASVAGAIILFLPVIVAFLGWSYHLGAVIDINRFEMDGATQVGMVQMMLMGVKELLIGPRSEKFVTVSKYMISAFFDSKLSFLGPGVIIVAVITLLFALAFFSRDKKGKIRTALLWMAFAVGFVGYYIFHIFMYVYVFGDEGYKLVSYNRYMYPYYMAWLSCAVILLGQAYREGKKYLPALATAAFSCGLLLLFNRYTDYDNLFIECNDRSFAVRKSISLKADYIKDAISPGDRIYLYSGGDNGERWFIYTFELIDNYIMEDEGVDTKGLNPRRAKEKYREEFRKRFMDYGITNVLIDSSSEFFVDTFGDLFDVDMEYVGLNSVAYYKVNYTEDGFYFTLVKGGTVNG